MGYMNSGEPYGTRLYYKEELEKLQKEFESMDKQKNYWWRTALHSGEALRSIKKLTNNNHVVDLINEALKYEPPEDK